MYRWVLVGITYAPYAEWKWGASHADSPSHFRLRFRQRGDRRLLGTPRGTRSCRTDRTLRGNTGRVASVRSRRVSPRLAVRARLRAWIRAWGSRRGAPESSGAGPPSLTPLQYVKPQSLHHPAMRRLAGISIDQGTVSSCSHIECLR